MITLTVVLSLLVVPYLVNLWGIKKREGKEWTITQGNHYAEKNWFPLVLKKRKAGETTTVTFKIDKSMLHDLPGQEDDADWNKITGEGKLDFDTLDLAMAIKKAPHQVNSWRLTWSYDPTRSTVLLGIYWYKHGLRFSQQIHEFYWSDISTKEFNLEVKRNPMTTEFRLYAKPYRVQMGQTVEVDHQFNGWTYRLRPYFGGNQPAPTECKVKYEFI